MPRHERFALNDGAHGEDGDGSRQNALEAIVNMRRTAECAEERDAW